MTPTDHRPAELLDLDRCDMETMSCEEFARRADALREVIRERWIAGGNVRAILELDRKDAERRRVMVASLVVAVVWVAFLGLALYLRSIGE